MINKLTGEPVSEEMQNVLKRLAVNEAVPESEIYALKEIKEANSCISSSKPTIELRNRTGIQLGVYNRLQNMGSAVTKSDGAVSFSGEIRREKRLDIVIGLPASGKSSALVEPISELYESRVIDSDEAKKLLPEFNNGWGDEVGSAALQSGQKIIEVSAELIKLLAPLLEKMLKELYRNSVDSINQIGGSIAERLAKGTVTNGELLYEANKAECGISTTSNILSADAKTFAAKAREYKIPVAVVGKGDKQTIEFLDRDKGIVNQITQEIMQERLKEAPQSVKCFNISANNVTAMKAAFEEQGLSCQFMKSADGKIKCVYPAENAEQVAVVKEDYKRVHGEISDDLDIRSDDKGIVIADDKLGKSFEYSPMNKAQTMELLREQFGYSEAKADLAANKICRDLKQDKDKFLAHTEQYDNLNSLKTNIRYPSDDLTLRDMRFNSVNFKDGGTTHIFISNGDKTAALTPEEMTETEILSRVL